MPDDRVAISAMTEATSLDNDDVVAVVHTLSGVDTTMKAKMTTVGTKLNKEMQFASDLNTNNKTIIGAINELQAGGGGGGSSTLAGLTDTNIVTPQNKQGLVYNSTSQKWENQDIASDFEITKSFSPTPIATITDGAENVPMKSLIVDITPRQASGTPTPSSPLPISGSDEVVITHTGANLFDYNNYEDIIVTSGGYVRKGHIFPSGSYTIINNSTTEDFYYKLIKSDLSDYGSAQQVHKNSSVNVTVNSGYIIAVYSAITPSDIFVGVGSNQTYEPYTATTETITLPSTVYGGEVDVVSGQGQDTHTIIDLGNINWIYDSTNQVFYSTTIQGIENGAPFWCSVYKDVGVTSVSNIPNYCGTLRPNALYIKNTDYSDKDAFKTAMNGVQFVYEVATPTTITTTPTTIKTQGGTESIFADCGDVSGEYYTEQVDDIVDLHNAIDAEKETALTGTLEAGETEITFTSDKITTDSLIDVYTSPVGINYSAIAVSTGEVVITFSEQASDIGVKVVIK